MGDLLNGGDENLVVPTDIRKIQQQDDTSVLITVLERLLLVGRGLKPPFKETFLLLLRPS